MQNPSEMVVRKNGGSPLKTDVLSTIERASELFPEDMRDRFRFNMNRMNVHEWDNERQRKKTLARVRAMFDSVYLGLEKQAVFQYLKAEGEFLLDYSNKVVKIGRKERLPVEFMGEYRFDDQSQLVINFKGKNWAFIPIVNANDVLPVEALRNAVMLKTKGIIWDGLYVGKPVIPVRTRTEVRTRDPIFAARIGANLIQLLRWK